MSITRRKSEKNYLNPKICYDIWMQVGTLKKTSIQLGELGYMNPKSKEKPHINSVTLAAWRYVLEEATEESREHFLKAGVPVARSMDVWLNFLLERKARQVLGISSRRRFIDWIRRWELEDLAIKKGLISEDERY